MKYEYFPIRIKLKNHELYMKRRNVSGVLCCDERLEKPFYNGQRAKIDSERMTPNKNNAYFIPTPTHLKILLSLEAKFVVRPINTKIGRWKSATWSNYEVLTFEEELIDLNDFLKIEEENNVRNR